MDVKPHRKSPSATKERANPFYLLLVIVGVIFTLTACAYGVLTIKAMRIGAMPRVGEQGYGLMKTLSNHGGKILGGELAVLTFATIGAIWLDDTRRKRLRSRPETSLAAEHENGRPVRVLAPRPRTEKRNC